MAYINKHLSIALTPIHKPNFLFIMLIFNFKRLNLEELE